MTSLAPVALAEMRERRDLYLKTAIFPVLSQVVCERPWIKSIGMLVAQYWDDEAADAVHAKWVCSQLDTPDLVSFFMGNGDDGDDGERIDVANLPEGEPDHWEVVYRSASGRFRDAYRMWDSNNRTIPLFAAYCTEDASQDSDTIDAYRPYCILRPQGEGFDIEVVGVQLRPWLDGAEAEWEDET